MTDKINIRSGWKPLIVVTRQSRATAAIEYIKLKRFVATRDLSDEDLTRKELVRK